MAYDASKDLHKNVDPSALGAKADSVTPNDSTDLTFYAKAVEVVAAGDLVYLPAKNADGDTITVTGAPVGYRTVCRVRRVLSTGTTATVIAVYD